MWAQKWDRFWRPWDTCLYWNLTSRLQKWVSIPVPFFGPTFSPFWNALHCFLTHKTSAKQALPKSISFLSAAKAASRCCTRGDNDNNNIVLNAQNNSYFFRHSGGPSNTWQKISTIFGPRSGPVDGTENWTANLQKPQQWKPGQSEELWRQIGKDRNNKRKKSKVHHRQQAKLQNLEETCTKGNLTNWKKKDALRRIADTALLEPVSRLSNDQIAEVEAWNRHENLWQTTHGYLKQKTDKTIRLRNGSNREAFVCIKGTRISCSIFAEKSVRTWKVVGKLPKP